MPKPHLNPDHFRALAAEYRGLARTSHSEQDKTELLNLAERLTALAQSDLWKAQPRRPTQERRSRRRTFKFASDPIA
jgi:hypothetical protein